MNVVGDGASAPPRRSAVIAAGQRLWQESLRDLINRDASVNVVGMARDYAGLELLVAAHHPDLLVARIPLPDLDHLEDLLKLRSTLPGLALLVLLPRSTTTGAAKAFAAAGGAALFTTDAHVWEVQAVLPLILGGWTAFAPEFRSRIGGPHVDGALAPGVLNAREKSVLQGLALGRKETAISASLGISVRTVQLHVARAREKLNASNRMHAVALAVRSGLIDVGSLSKAVN